jgi:F0F1-type ATP synthase assembly protein I
VDVPMVGRRPPGNKPTWIRYSSIGFEFAAAVGGFALVGFWIDRRYETGPWGVIIGAALGLIGGTYNLIRQSMAAFKTMERENAKADSNRNEKD